MRRIIPNTLTSLNLISGCIAIRFALMGQTRMALAFIIIGAVFDFFDGFSARLLKVPSPIGIELDSLADCVTFGVAPASIIFQHLSESTYPTALASVADYIPYTAYILAAFSAIRLAKFNLDTRQTTSFIGIPTPANALFWSSLLCAANDWLHHNSYGWLLILAAVCVTSWLLVAELPMLALKFKSYGWKGNERRFLLIVLSIALLVTLGPINAWASIIACYVVISSIKV